MFVRTVVSPSIDTKFKRLTSARTKNRTRIATSVMKSENINESESAESTEIGSCEKAKLHTISIFIPNRFRDHN